MNVLLDTNIVVHSMQERSGLYLEITKKIEELLKDGHQLYICRQVLFEYYCVVTKPVDKNGYGYTSAKAMEEVEDLMQIYDIIDDVTDMNIWKDIMITYSITGLKSHDARLVATMESNAINNIFTKNEADFRQFGDRITLM
jgi:predicted nucleic acid-binding protein